MTIQRKVIWGWRILAISFPLIVISTIWLIGSAAAQTTTTPTTDAGAPLAPLVVLGSAVLSLVGVIVMFGRTVAKGELVPAHAAETAQKLTVITDEVLVLQHTSAEREADALKREDRLWSLLDTKDQNRPVKRRMTANGPYEG